MHKNLADWVAIKNGCFWGKNSLKKIPIGLKFDQGVQKQILYKGEKLI